MEITSKSNLKYKKIKELISKDKNIVFIEGLKIFLELQKSNLKLLEVFVSSDLNTEPLKLNKNIEVTKMSKDLLASLFTTKNKPTKEDLICAIAKRPEWKKEDLIKDKKTLIYLEDIQDPGNLGGIFRSALAFNCGGILLSKNSTDIFNTKVIRSSAGAVFHLPFYYVKDLNELEEIKIKNKYKIYATAVGGKDMPIINPSIILFGNEGHGLSEDLLKLSDETIKVNHNKNVESLNLNVAVGIILSKLYV